MARSLLESRHGDRPLSSNAPAARPRAIDHPSLVAVFVKL
jgi:hypothetical protein